MTSPGVAGAVWPGELGLVNVLYSCQQYSPLIGPGPEVTSPGVAGVPVSPRPLRLHSGHSHAPHPKLEEAWSHQRQCSG